MRKGSDINVGSIEEDIKILERFKNDEMQRDKLERDNRCGGWKIGDIYKLLELNTAIEHLLSDYARQKQINEEHQKINGELREKVKELEEQVEYDKTHIYTPMTIQLNFIPKQKIKDKIEELENIKVQLPVQHLKDAQIKVLQELLQESEDK